MDKVQKIQKHLQENGIYAEINEENGAAVVSIEWGDWKHEHGYCNYLMSQLGYNLVSEIVTEEDGSDCYSSDHYYVEKSLLHPMD